ncbi:probable secreted glycoprotein [Halobacterium hubeiense]|uniref:Probable secreted glycoprotein n=1 Tax=Halobacterium hubeiense TaxID=1407499 RepID=A0A0U5CV57_9EURY|nr:probable secreted glycoprotein [Halobacterium hubeiense]
MPRNVQRIDRRTALQTVASAAVASLAGCLSQNSPASDGTTAAGGPLQRVAVDGTTVIVALVSEADVDRLNLIQPNGELFAQQSVAAGVQQVSFEIGTTYPPGEYDIVALREDETIVETTIPIEPTLEIVEMGIGRNQPEEMWTGAEDEISEEAFITVSNQGTGPEAITKLLFIGDVPYPSDEQGTNYAGAEDVSGIYDSETDSEVGEVLLPADEQLTIYSSRSPFAFVPGGGTSCTNEEQTGKFDLILETRVGGDRVSKSYNIRYSASNEQEDCAITISEV